MGEHDIKIETNASNMAGTHNIFKEKHLQSELI